MLYMILYCSSCRLQAACVASFYHHRGLLYATIITSILKKDNVCFLIVADQQSPLIFIHLLAYT